MTAEQKQPTDPTCRLIPYAVADGPTNMAADQVLLESAEAGIASVRFYGWSEATVSIGYFQPERLRREDEILAALPFVRRASGGSTLVHHHEVTYALALPVGAPWQAPGKPADAWLCRMHAIIASALNSLGVEAAAAPCLDTRRFAGVLCFQKITPGDLLLSGSKVVGSAQRRQRGALLQHGGILLAASPYAAVLPGIAELSGRNLSAGEVCKAVRGELARQTGWRLVPGDWAPTERLRIADLTASKYGHDSWNCKR